METKGRAYEILAQQRSSGEARDILKDLEALNSQSDERKARWIWELIQNAVDCFTEKAINIKIHISESELRFEHDGGPLYLGDLLALARKTSTKPLEGITGKKGRFGTGFVATQALSKHLTVSGILRNDSGDRRIKFNLDRRATTADGMEKLLSVSYSTIDDLDNLPAEEGIGETWTCFSYPLETIEARNIATAGLEALKQNLAFTLLLNRKELRSIRLVREGVEDATTALSVARSATTNTSFRAICPPKENGDALEEILELQEGMEGLLFQESSEATIAFPAIWSDGRFNLKPISHQARLFRHFPLIGTEDAHIPCFFHSELFQPAEPRDGVRTRKVEALNEEDRIADSNRLAFSCYVKWLPTIVEELIHLKVANLHLLAESGLPADSRHYLGEQWYRDEVQGRIRSALMTFPLVQTVSGNSIKMAEAKFSSEDFVGEQNLAFHQLVGKFYPDYCPSADSNPTWIRTLHQDVLPWQVGTIVRLEDLLRVVNACIDLHGLEKQVSPASEWLNALLDFLELTQRTYLLNEHAILPCQNGRFMFMKELRSDPGIGEDLKKDFGGIVRDLDFELLDGRFERKGLVEPFDLIAFFKLLNGEVGNSQVADISQEKMDAILSLGTYFRDTKAAKREELFDLLRALRPDLVSSKRYSDAMDGFDYESVDRFNLKYACWKIQESKTLKVLSELHFEGNEESAIHWVNRLISFVESSNEQSKDGALKFAIYLTNDGVFRKFDAISLRRWNPELPGFSKYMKDLIVETIKQPDPDEVLLFPPIISNDVPMAEENFLSVIVDNIFKLQNIEDLVADNGKWQPLFHQVNSWVSDEKVSNEEEKKRLLPFFHSKRPELSVRAYGKEMSAILARKSIEEIRAISNLSFSASDLQQLAEAAELAGGVSALLEKAKEMRQNKEEDEWRKWVGKTAEKAFEEAMEGFDAIFDLNNPDDGKDFTIISLETGKKYYVEIKSTVLGSESVRMSQKQGATAVIESSVYALCVIARPANTEVTTDYFKENASFVVNIGEEIGDKIQKVERGICEITLIESGEVSVALDNKSYGVYVRKKIWEKKMVFPDFVEHVKSLLLLRDDRNE